MQIVHTNNTQIDMVVYDYRNNAHYLKPGQSFIEVRPDPPVPVSILSVSQDTTLTKAQTKGHLILVSGEVTITLPRVTKGDLVTIYSVDASAVTAAPNSDDRIILDGVALDEGQEIVSAGGAGDLITLVGDSPDGWVQVGRASDWTAA
jgi:hypothetical protein